MILWSLKDQSQWVNEREKEIDREKYEFGELDNYVVAVCAVAGLSANPSLIHSHY